MIFVGNVVLGNITISKLIAALIVGLVLTLGMYTAPIAAKYLDLKIKLSKEVQAATVYFASNLILLWVLKRLADFTGLGIANIGYVIVLAAVFALIQTFSEQYADKMAKQLK